MSREDGFTLVELLVAAAMGAILFGATASLMISAMKSQPKLSKRAQNISTARWVTERMTREIRNGIAVDKATASSVSFRAYVRHTACGGSTPLPSSSPAKKCEITYTCTTTTCTRIEAAEDTYTGTAKTIIGGMNNSDVFSYSPSATEATFVRITLKFPNPSGSGDFTISDGASLRNATLAY